MRIIDTKILTGDNHPQLKVQDKLYTRGCKINTRRKRL